MSAPKISIIVPVYNTEKYIERCISSIITQSFPDFEIICVDDASIDSSYKILQKLSAKDKRIKLWRNAQNEGAGFTKNFAMQQACGKYLCFVDSDDWIVEDTLKTLYENAEKYDVDDVFYLSYGMKEGSQKLTSGTNSFSCFEHLRIYNGLQFLDFMLENKCLTVGAVHHFCKRELILKYTSFSEKSINDDMEFTCNLLGNLNSVLFFRQEFYVYFHRKSGSISNTKRDILFYKDSIYHGLALYKSLGVSKEKRAVAEKILIFSIVLAETMALNFSDKEKDLCHTFLNDSLHMDNKIDLLNKANYYGLHINISKETFCKLYSKDVFIYGTGVYASDVYRVLQARDIFVKAFIVTNKQTDFFLGKEVFGIKDVTIPNNAVLIIGTSEKFYDEILKNEKVKEFPEVILCNDL